MKKLVSLLIVCLMVFSLASCGTDGENADGNGGIEVNENLLNVEVLLPASLFEDKTAEEIKSDAEKAGVAECVVNEDGTVKYVMSKSKHKEMLDGMKSNVDNLINEMMTGEDKIDTIVSVDYNDSLTEINIVTTSETVTMWESFSVLSFYFSCSYYQLLAGVDNDDVDVIVNFINQTSNQIIHTASYKEYIKNLENSSSAEEATEEATDASAITRDAVAVSEKQTITIADVCEFFVDYTAITSKVVPPSPASYYTYYDAESGKVYVDICFAYKNLESSAAGADEVVSATLIYGGKYQYKGFSIIEENNRGDFTYSNITSIDPLSQEYVHYLFALPKEAESSGAKIDIQFTIGSNKYLFNVRGGTEGEVSSLSSGATSKTSGTIVDDEIIAIVNKCEFYIDYSNITDRVNPPSPADYYSYYEAEDGKVYVDICIAYKNWKSSCVQADSVVSGKLTYADKYEYNGNSVIEEKNRGDFTYSNITSISPLTWEYVHYLFEVPDEVATSSESLFATFTINENTYTYKIR